MGYIQCCSALHKCRTFLFKTDKTTVFKQVDYLEKCPICGHTVLQLSKVDLQNKISVYRIKNKKARTFLEKYTKDIIKEEENFSNKYIRYRGKFYLNYNEYGKIKRCYSNLSTMKLGLFDRSI